MRLLFSALTVLIFTLVGGVMGFVVVGLWAEAEINAQIAKHGGDDGGGTELGAAIFWGLPGGLILGCIVGLAIVWLFNRMYDVLHGKAPKSLSK